MVWVNLEQKFTCYVSIDLLVCNAMHKAKVLYLPGAYWLYKQGEMTGRTSLFSCAQNSPSRSTWRGLNICRTWYVGPERWRDSRHRRWVLRVKAFTCAFTSFLVWHHSVSHKFPFLFLFLLGIHGTEKAASLHGVHSQSLIWSTLITP